MRCFHLLALQNRQDVYRAKTIALSGEESSRDHSTLLQVHVAADLKVAAVASTKKLKTKAVRSYLALCEIQGGGEEEEDKWDNKINRSWKNQERDLLPGQIRPGQTELCGTQRELKGHSKI